ncbi:NAD(P)H-dependent oxidoreductase [Actinomadura rudentiformis]|uniref:NAD(P)H-dependent oxidoreductase n=1 Tax=Actinomadura rudentiformis TaxID=359158 RepID=UPI00178C3237|nr:NAD(P)H-dependent oxidoreductase [Actinomadura rudentiformis]
MRIAIIITGAADHADRAVAEWLAGRVHARGDAEVDLLDLGAACLPDRPAAHLPTPPAVRDLTPWLGAANGFLLVLPGTPPDQVRRAVSWCGDCWRAKPVGLIWYGVVPDAEGEVCALEVRSLLDSVGAVTIGEAVRFADSDRSGQADLMLAELVSRAREVPDTPCTAETPLE